MHIVRLSGDVCHVVAIIILFLKIWRSKSCAGISGKSQVLFALVFTTRYLDLFIFFISIYNTVMKVGYLILAYTTVSLIYFHFRNTYDSENDSFRIEILLVPVAGLAFLVNHDFTLMESCGYLGSIAFFLVINIEYKNSHKIMWTFSIYLESVAILPQMFMIRKTGEADSFITHYLFFLGLYRTLYIGNWVWRYYYEGFYDQIAAVSGVVQTIIFFCFFFYLYFTRVLRGSAKVTLPMSVTELSDPAPSLGHTQQ